MNQEDNYKELVGIIGGVGPEATNYFTSLLIKLRLPYATKDQDHIPYLLFNNPQIPDRSKHILFNGENPIPEIIKTGLLLKRAGATFLVIPCNTAHTFTEEMEKGIGLPILSMVDVTAQHIYETYGKDVTVGVLATDGTVQSGTYQKAFTRIAPEMSVLFPDTKGQMDVMRAIYEIKAFSVNELNSQLLYNAAQKLRQKGATIIILGCTEIPLAFTDKMNDFITIDPMEITARKVISRTVKSKTNTDTNRSRFYNFFRQRHV